MSFHSATVVATMARRREETAAEYLDNVRADRWLVVLPEIVFCDAQEIG